VIDNVNGSYAGVTHLIENGHRKIGYLKSSITIQNFIERYEGYEKALAMQGIEKDGRHTVSLRPTLEDAYQDMLAYLSEKPSLPTAFFSDNDIIAFGAMKAIKEAGIQIPQDVSLVGFDDMPFCTITEPSLSTISVNKQVLGEFAVEGLISLIAGNRNCHSKKMLGVELIQRGSVLRLNMQ
jgi:LacI family transcriptional regulator